MWNQCATFRVDKDSFSDIIDSLIFFVMFLCYTVVSICVCRVH